MNKTKIFLIYLIFFLLFFLQLPLSGCIPGKSDCWWHLAVFSDFASRLYAMTHHVPVTTSYFPAKAFWLYGEPSFGVGGLYLFIHSVLHDYVWSFYLLYAILFSLTAFSFYLLAGQFIVPQIPRLAGGLLFTTANFYLGHLDHQNTFFWAIAFFTVRSFYQFNQTGKIYRLYLIFILGGMQVYFSTTIFIYLLLWLIILFSMHYRIWASPKVWPHFLAGSLIFILFSLPMIAIYVNSPEIKNAYNPALFANGNVMSNIWPRDLLRFLPENFLHPVQSDIDFDLLYNIKCASPGIVLLTLFFYGLRFLPKIEFLPLAILGIILALGSEIKIGSLSIPMPMKLYYSNFLHSPFLRTPIRAYFLVHWVLCMGAVFGLSRIRGLLSKRITWTLLISALFIVENVPLHLQASPVARIISESNELSGFLKTTENTTILHLPSQVFPRFPVELNSYRMNTIAREYFYSFAQTLYKKNTVNGSAAYFPPKRIAINQILQLKSRKQFHEMLREYNIKYVVWHGDLIMESERHLLDSLTAYPYLNLEKKIDNCFIFSAQ